MPSAVITPPRARARRVRPGLLVSTGVAVVAMLWLAHSLTRDAAVVPRITIQNPSSVDVEIDLAAARRGPSLELGRAPAGSTHTYHDVLDLGERWSVHIESPVGELVDLVVDRAALDDNGWTVRLPRDLADREAAMRSGP